MRFCTYVVSSLLLALSGVLGLVILGGAGGVEPSSNGPAATESWIVQATKGREPGDLVSRVGGAVTHELRIIGAVSAELSEAQRRELATVEGVKRIWRNGRAELTGKPDKGGSPKKSVVDTFYVSHLGADQVHSEGIDGAGITVAVLDSGAFTDQGIVKDVTGKTRVLASFDPRSGEEELPHANGWSTLVDSFGHGSHVTSIALSSRMDPSGTYNGVAPAADLVVVSAFDQTGTSSYADVIAGLDWILANQGRFGIRVLNCSFSAEPQSHYWDDPLNQAIMELWRAGIVVVASAGNRGPEAMTIGAPGNVPYVITVGAMTDNFTPENMEDDILASFSSAGPTVEGFVKPDVVAPGGHVKGLMNTDSQIALDHPEFHDGGYYFNMSGTSQATAFVTGIVALMLHADPTLTPDQVKYRLMDSARPASFPSGGYAYTVFQQGAGLVDAYQAVHSTRLGVTHPSLNIELDISGVQHFGGPVDAYEKKGKGGGYVFFVRDQYGNPVEDDGYLWSDKYYFTDGYLWSDGYLWTDAFLWTDGYLWSDGYLWTDAYLWSDAFLWTDLQAEALFTESWVPQE